MFGHCNNNLKRGRSNAWNIIFLGKGDVQIIGCFKLLDSLWYFRLTEFTNGYKTVLSNNDIRLT